MPEEKHCKIVTTSGEYIASESFKVIREKLMTKEFCMCHGSYCVNLNYVEKYTKTEVSLRYKTTEYKIYMSRRQYAAFKKQMFIVGGEKI